MEVKKENRWGKGKRGATKGPGKPTTRPDNLQFLPRWHFHSDLSFFGCLLL
jgi:hypothetical protein